MAEASRLKEGGGGGVTGTRGVRGGVGRDRQEGSDHSRASIDIGIGVVIMTLDVCLSSPTANPPAPDYQ